MNMDSIERQLEQIFAAYEIDELSISTLPDIINDIKGFIRDESAAAFGRGVVQGQASEIAAQTGAKERALEM